MSNAQFCIDCNEADLFGVAGICNATARTCTCPGGYAGSDDWTEFNSCHVYLDLKRNFHLVVGLLIALCACVLFIATIFSFRVHRKIRLKTQLDKRAQKKERSQLALSFVCLFFFLAMIFNSWYELQFLPSDREKVTIDIIQILPFSLTFTFQSCAGYALVLAWAHTLPDPTSFGKLFDYPSFFLKWPRLVFHVSKLGLAFALVRGLLEIVLLSNNDNDPSEIVVKFAIMDSLSSIGISLLLLAYARNLENLLSLSITRIETSSRNLLRVNRQLKDFKEAKAVIGWSYLIVGTIVTTCIIIGIVVIFYQGKTQFFFMSVHFAVVNVLITIWTLRLMNSYQTRLFIISSSNSKNSDQSVRQK